MKLRKLVSIVLAAAMTFALAMPAFAAGTPSPAKRHNAPSNSSSHGTANQGGGPTGVGYGTIDSNGGLGTIYYGWHYVPELDKWWYEYNDRTWAVGWAKLYWKPWGADTGYDAWYHFDNDGWMDTGWYHDTDNNDYFLHPVADGTRGYMYTGTHNLGGANYSFEETAGQMQGHLLR